MKKSGWIPVAFGAALLLSACGDAATATTSTVATIGSTNYHTIPPTPSTLAPTTTVAGAPGPPAGSVTTEVTEYTIADGDVEFTVANKFGITLDALRLANADTQGYSAFYVGLKIKIPVGATIPDQSATTTTAAGSTDTAEPTTTLAGGGSNCAQGSYTIQDGDLPGKVAQKFDVTVAQLDAANQGTKGYKNFIVGVKIIIPAKEGCTG